MGTLCAVDPVSSLLLVFGHMQYGSITDYYQYNVNNLIYCLNSQTLQM